MYSLYRKEIKTFLGSLIGILVIIVFLLVTGLFLWVFPGVYNIPDTGYATLEGLFSLAPWLYLFLVPAITMRLFADEKRTGTIEILFTHPISDFQLVSAKFFAGLMLVVFSLLPTLLYFLSVFLLGNPIGSIDVGATWGSFIGLFFLAAIYVAIGVFASSLTDNQIVSFILALAVSFVFYLGFDFIASSGIPYFLEQILSYFSINNHYLSISSGVVDMRDMVYFVGMALFFLFITSVLLRRGNLKLRKVQINVAVFIVSLFAVFFISTNFLFRADLTADKRFSLSDISREIASNNNNIIEIELYLEGELEPGLQKLQQEIFEKIAVLNVYSPKPIRLKITDPYKFSSSKKAEEFQEQLIEKGIQPISFNRKTDQGISTKYIFPGAVISSGQKKIAVNFLKNNPDFSYEVNFNHSIESVEFELINAFQKLGRDKKSTVAFLEGHAEFNQYEVLDFTNALKGDFNLNRITIQALETKLSEIDILIVAGPKQPFSEKDKFIIDQFVMQGGKVVWLIDPVQVSLDSLSNGYQTFAFPLDLNLADQLFKYGVRLNYELLQDVDCAQLLVNTAPAGSQAQWNLFPWYYSPLLIPSDDHPLSRNLNRIYTEFVSSVDTVSGNQNLVKSIILTTSPYARRVKSPSSVSLENIKNPPARELFNQSFIPVGVLVEGEFTSVFENRMMENLGISNVDFEAISKPTKMVVIGDAGLIANAVNYSKQPPQIQELGYDRVSKQTFGNKEFLLNAIYYLNDEAGIMQLRSRTVQLRLLDKVKLREEKTFWQWLNIVTPIVIVLVFGLGYNFIRRYRYSR
ncbi:MAG TPA: gliding motility-associated ABC transporter substrate-binding protein GldG [Draconibacterium sp.]|nr:gliding motility-associated ABC transporter substrate-binding protein GldG [Draconibacterium sp.]